MEFNKYRLVNYCDMYHICNGCDVLRIPESLLLETWNKMQTTGVPAALMYDQMAYWAASYLITHYMGDKEMVI